MHDSAEAGKTAGKADSDDDVIAEMEALREELAEVKKLLSESKGKGTDSAGVRSMRQDLAKLRAEIKDRNAKAKEAVEASMKSKADLAAGILERRSNIVQDIQKEFAKDMAAFEDGMMLPFGKSLMLDFDRPFRQMEEMEDSFDRIQRNLERRQAKMFQDTPELDDIVDEAVKAANEEGKTRAKIVKETDEKRIEVIVERGTPGQKTLEVKITRKDESGAPAEAATEKIELTADAPEGGEKAVEGEQKAKKSEGGAKKEAESEATD